MTGATGSGKQSVESFHQPIPTPGQIPRSASDTRNPIRHHSVGRTYPALKKIGADPVPQCVMPAIRLET